MIRREELQIDGRPAYVWRGGTGTSLVLLHGGWGGAEMHWAPVWDALTHECRVIAPEFPGLAYESPWILRSLNEAAQWIDKILDATNTPAAWIAGNSLGAAVASRVASQSPKRCLGLILINGGPPPSMPAVLRPLMTRWPLRKLMLSMLRRTAWTPSAVDKAFADPRRAPAELTDVLTQPRPPQLRISGDMLLAGDRPRGLPDVRTLVIWGAEDRLPTSTAKMRERLLRSLPNARLVIIPGAGHLPQIEQPDQLARTVIEFLRTGT